MTSRVVSVVKKPNKTDYKMPLFSAMDKECEDFDTADSIIKAMFPKEPMRVRKGSESVSLIYHEVPLKSFYDGVVKPFIVKGDVFVDLGCGRGKLLLLVAIASQASRCIGVEIVQDYLDTFKSSVKSAAPMRQFKKCEVIQHDLNTNYVPKQLNDATVIFVNNAKFDEALNVKVENMLVGATHVRCVVTTRSIVVSKRHISEFGTKFQFQQEVNLPSIFRLVTTGYLYVVSDQQKSNTIRALFP
jgi:hypothetical protein